MEPTQFPNVRPAPFLIARTPGSFFGRSAEPTMPAVGGYNDQDLERMRFALMQSGGDPAMLGRIQHVMAMRGINMPTPAPEMVLLNPNRRKPGTVGWRKHNPFDQVADALPPQ